MLQELLSLITVNYDIIKLRLFCVCILHTTINNRETTQEESTSSSWNISNSDRRNTGWIDNRTNVRESGRIRNENRPTDELSEEMRMNTDERNEDDKENDLPNE